MILNELDSSKTAILNPSDFYKPIKDFPKTIFMIFSKTLIKSIVEIFEPETIITISNANMDFPGYKLNI